MSTCLGLLGSLVILFVLHDLIIILEHILDTHVDGKEQEHICKGVPEVRLDVELRPAAVVEQPLRKGEEDEECRNCQHGQKNEERYPEVLDLLVVRYEKEVYEEYYY